MTDEGKLRTQYERGEEAKRIKDNELVKEFFDQYEQTIWNTFKASNLDDDRGQKNCRFHLRVLEDFKKHFETLIANGNYAGQQLAEGQKKGLFKR